MTRIVRKSEKKPDAHCKRHLPHIRPANRRIKNLKKIQPRRNSTPRPLKVYVNVSTFPPIPYTLRTYMEKRQKNITNPPHDAAVSFNYSIPSALNLLFYFGDRIPKAYPIGSLCRRFVRTCPNETACAGNTGCSDARWVQ